MENNNNSNCKHKNKLFGNKLTVNLFLKKEKKSFWKIKNNKKNNNLITAEKNKLFHFNWKAFRNYTSESFFISILGTTLRGRYPIPFVEPPIESHSSVLSVFPHSIILRVSHPMVFWVISLYINMYIKIYDN